MRLFKILTAALVLATLYALVFERARLLELAGLGPDAPAGAPAPEAPAQAQAAQAGDGARPVAVVAQRSHAREVSASVLLRGRTEAARSVVVKSETTGRVVSPPLPRGASVAAGQVLCAVDPGTRGAALAEAEARLPEATARLAEAKARLAEAEINNRAARALTEGGFASETRLAATEAALESAQAAVASARAGLQAAQAGAAAARVEIDRLSIRAPFEGLLESDTAELGALLQPGAPCATVIQLDPIRLLGFVPETEVERVRIGAPAQARLASGRVVGGQVTFVSRAADEATRTLHVEVEVGNGDGSIRDGLTVEIAITAEGEPGHLLPASALTLDDSGTLGVRLADAGRARFAPVRILRDTPEGVWLAGLPETADVIVVGQEFVTDGVALDLTLREAAP